MQILLPASQLMCACDSNLRPRGSCDSTFETRDCEMFLGLFLDAHALSTPYGAMTARKFFFIFRNFSLLFLTDSRENVIIE